MSDEETNEKKAEGVTRRWTRKAQEALANTGERSSKKFNYTCFEGLKLSELQKKFVVIYMDAPFFGRKEHRYEAYKKVFVASSDNSLRSNCSALMSKTKIKEAILAYQKYALTNHKIEVTTESIENLRRRSNYSVNTFYEKDGTPKPLDQIDEEWLICIDSIDTDWKLSNQNEKKIVKYKLCDRDKATNSLQKLLGVSQEMERIEVSVPTSAGKNAIDSVGAEKNSGPRISLNMTVGNVVKEN